jgi:hypothetical protein
MAAVCSATELLSYWPEQAMLVFLASASKVISMLGFRVI